MPDFKIPRVSQLFVVAFLLVSPLVVRASDLEQAFRAPPAATRPWVFWYWMQGAVSRSGITADLAAMKQAGLGGAYLMPINGPANPPVFTPAVTQLSPEWWALVKFAASEADRLDLKLGMSICDGFATAGGPWITPELSMQKIVWSETQVGNDGPFTGELPQPHAQENYYRDIAVFAYPSPSENGPSVTPKITTNVAGVDAQFLATGGGNQQLRSDGPCWIQYEYATAFTLRSLVIRQWDKNYAGLYHATRLKIETSDNGVDWKFVTRLEPPRHGWQDWDADYTFSVPTVTAKFFRFLHDPTGAEPGSEDLNGAKWKPRLLLRGLELSSVPRIPGFEGKSGAVWRRSARAVADQLPETLCVPRNEIIDLTAHLKEGNRLDWTPPPGRWTILRIGHTSTGHRNETAGGGRGLECDKFNPLAIRLQFDRWFGAATRELGPELTRRVLKVFHVDSWEAGSQNWSPVFREEFQRRRGYDPLPMLPAFAGVPVGSARESEQFLADVRETIADLTVDNFFGTLAELAHAHGCEFSAESTAPTMMGDGLRHFGKVDVPMGEFWLRSPTHDKPNDIHDAVSGAHLYGKNIVQAEAFTELRLQWDEHPGMLKSLADHQFALGINRFIFHVFAHNPWMDRRPGMTLNGVGLYFQRDQTWWPDARAWVDYIARCSALLQLGQPVADVAYFTGEELPSRAILPERRSPGLPLGYMADSINRDALLKLAELKNGRLVLPGGGSYAALVVSEDGVARSPALNAKLREIRPAVIESGESLASHLASLDVPPDLLARIANHDEPAKEIEWTHRKLPDAEIYFISNQREETRVIDLSLRITGRRPEIWNPVTGEMVDAQNFRQFKERTLLPVKLEPYGSRFIVLRRVVVAQNLNGPNWIEPRLAQSLTGSWRVTFDPALGGPHDAIVFDSLTNWTTHADPAIRYYSGPASYAQSFEWPERKRRTWLDLGEVHNLARVTLNGIDCGVAWTPPYRVEITRALRTGTNALELRVTNTWSNRLLGDKIAPSASGPITQTTAPARENGKLLPAGLLGPVKILVEE